MKRGLFILILLSSLNLTAQSRFSTDDYISLWKITAIEQMNDHKIPASITLAQGILESGNGNSKLAKEAKNHFGIKCHKAWSGDTFFQDDDKANECFRSYTSASASYKDHSLFLTGRSRYAGLFSLRLTDYKGWAKGLKSAGYATNPKYAYLLIDLIEKYELDKYDHMSDLPRKIKEEKELSVSKPQVEEVKPIKINNVDLAELKSTEIVYEYIDNSHSKKLNKNKATYIIVKKGDTFFKISQEFEMTLNQLYKYNEFSKKDVLKIGDIVYVAPKKGRGRKGNPVYICLDEKTIREIAHIEGVRMKKLLKFNLMENPDTKLPIGTKVILR